MRSKSGDEVNDTWHLRRKQEKEKTGLDEELNANLK